MTPRRAPTVALLLLLSLMLLGGAVRAESESAEPPGDEAGTPADQSGVQALTTADETDEPALSVPQQGLERRLEAIAQLGTLGDDAAVPTLTRVVSVDPVEDARLAAVEALGELGSSAAHRALVLIADTGYGYRVCQRAATLAVETAREGPERAEVIRRLAMGVPLETLLRVLRTDEDAEVRLESLQLLRQHGHWPDFDEDLTRIVDHDESEAMRDIATELLERDRLHAAREALDIAGPSLLVSSYGIDVLASLGSFLISLGNGQEATAQAGLRLLLPIAGPIWAANVGRYSDKVVFHVLGWLDAVFQVAGVTMSIMALVMRRRERRQQRSDLGARRRAVGALLLPSGPSGFALVGWFG